MPPPVTSPLASRVMGPATVARSFVAMTFLRTSQRSFLPAVFRAFQTTVAAALPYAV
jgi:hypothetical protein